FIQGNYTFAPAEETVFGFYSALTYGPQNVTFEYSNGATKNFTFPNLPGYVIINQSMTIIVTYNWILSWTYLG
ncbi:MAG: hypothetical protein QXH75_01420, partial [Sulfolobaceae archaeon]